MTEKKLQRYLKKNLEPPSGQKTHIPVVLSDSKGERLSRVVSSNNIVESSIIWWYKKGDTIEKRYEWLSENLSSKLRLLGSIHLYIWLGTCNLTTIDKNHYISLTTDPEATLKNIIEYYHKIPKL